MENVLGIPIEEEIKTFDALRTFRKPPSRFVAD